MRLALHRFAATAALAELRPVVQSLATKEKHSARARVHGPAIERRPDTQRILLIMKQGRGIRAAPEAVLASAVWKHKFLAADVAEQLVYENDPEGRATVASLAIAVASVSARVVLTALEICRTDGTGHFEGAKIAKQSYKEDPGWAKSTTRGSGIVFDNRGKELYFRAVDALMDSTRSVEAKRKHRVPAVPPKRPRRMDVDSDSDTETVSRPSLAAAEEVADDM